jgi:hypothetical protein
MPKTPPDGTVLTVTGTTTVFDIRPSTSQLMTWERRRINGNVLHKDAVSGTLSVTGRALTVATTASLVDPSALVSGLGSAAKSATSSMRRHRPDEY